MNIAIAKMGRTIKFDRSHWGHGAGNNEPGILISALANSNPENNYYIIGKSDFSKLSDDLKNTLFINNNVFDGFKDFNIKKHDIEMYSYNQLKNIDFDYGIIIGGVAARVNMKDKFYKINKDTKKADKELGFVSPLNMFHSYAAPIINFLNYTNIPWTFFTSDARQVPIAAHDLINREVGALGTMEKQYKSKYFSGLGDGGQDVTYQINDMVYAGAELVTVLDHLVPKYSGQEKTINLGMFFHKYDDKKRNEKIKSYINMFDKDSISVFGKWKEELAEGDERFKGPVSFDEVQNIMLKTKYTVCYPITKGDISAKWIEAIRAGVVPFLLESYDQDHNLNENFDFPEELYVSSQYELLDKINYYNNNDAAYNKLIKKLSNIYDYISDNILDYYNEMFAEVPDKK